ncbi:hypothetical protein SAMN05216551_111137 [Chitinasiproducens palmae]|uniref:Uncharacterized protein n=1 Tax=Chitinasiproducens palmae TaxID=1770053 RepID=A0A1H2PVA9_9BURK|nr:hypothetical protein SAMN05216551_111137 [Chitinasiproducens palmae]
MRASLGGPQSRQQPPLPAPPHYPAFTAAYGAVHNHDVWRHAGRTLARLPEQQRCSSTGVVPIDAPWPCERLAGMAGRLAPRH